MANLVERLSYTVGAKATLFEVIPGRRDSEPAKEEAIPRRTLSASCPLSFAQQRLWFLNQIEPSNSAYNFSRAFLLTGAIDVTVLESCVSELLNRHEILRTTFHAVAGEPLQRISPMVAW